jgi:hypothetical protein
MVKEELSHVKLKEEIWSMYTHHPAARKGLKGALFSRNNSTLLNSPKKTTILVGDFNAVEHENDVKLKTRKRRSKITNKQLKELIEAFQMKDAWLAKGGKRSAHTFFYPKGSSRLDRMYVSNELTKEVNGISYRATELTDHLAVIMETTCTHQKTTNHKSGPWKMNIGILKEPKFRIKFQEWWEGINKFKIKKNKLREWWDNIFKTGLKRLAIDSSKIIAKEKRDQRMNDQLLLGDIIEKFNQGEHLWEELKTVKKSIKKWEKEVISRELLKNKPEHKIADERCTTFQIKKSQKSNQIKEIEVNNTLIKDKSQIKQEIEKHFKNIFQKEWINLDERRKESLEIIQTENLKNEMTNVITETEIKAIIDKCKNLKSPGQDGIPYEFYKEFLPILKERMTELFNEIIENEEMAGSQSLAMIKMIPKKSNATKLSDFRPISLLCTDYKILAGVLAERLKPVLSKVIGPSQKGGVPKRSLFNSLSLFRDVMARVDELNKEPETKNNPSKFKKKCAAIVSIDLEKAYDLVQREYLWEIMSKMGFPSKFVNILKGLYKSCILRIFNGDENVVDVEGRNSIRQGCPLSMHLFTIFVEPLVRKIESEVQGFQHGQQRAATRAFVDDLNVIVCCDNDLIKLDNILKEFCEHSGANFNRNKTCIMGIGGWEGRTNWPLQWIESTMKMKILGITFHQHLKSTIEENWRRIKSSITGQLTRNAGRKLTIQQRNAFVKTFILPQALHVAKILPCPQATADVLRKNMQRFIWYGKIERPDPGVQIMQEKEGGIGFIDPENFFKAALSKTMIETIDGEEGLEKELMEYWTYFSLKASTGMRRTNAPKAMMTPDHLLIPVKTINFFFQETNIPITKNIKTKDIYQLWANKNKRKSKLETKHPKLLNWKNVWRNCRKMAPEEKEILFLLNHDLLPNMTRLHRMKISKTAKCQYCKKFKETNVHLFLKCPAKQQATRNFKKEIKENVVKAFRGDVSDPANLKKVGQFIRRVWKSRKKIKNPAG